MDIEFLVHDTYSMVRPQWKLAGDLEEATRLFGEAVSQNYKFQDPEKAVEVEEEDAESVSSDDGLEDDGIPDIEDEQDSSDEAADASLIHFLSFHAHMRLEKTLQDAVC